MVLHIKQQIEIGECYQFPFSPPNLSFYLQFIFLTCPQNSEDGIMDILNGQSVSMRRKKKGKDEFMITTNFLLQQDQDKGTGKDSC